MPSATTRARALANPAADAPAKALYRYLWRIYRHKTLTGQQESDRQPDGPRAELDYIERTTGKLPAILGLDYITPNDQNAVNDRATRWYRDGGIPTICWHWGAPDIGTGYENAKKDFDVAAALRPGTPQNKAMTRDLAHVGDLLTVLRDRGVPVLWRPFHEFSGDWFWWGKHGPGAFKALWTLMYDYFTRDRELTNLIWVLGWAGQNIDPAYNPGRDRFDIAGADLYVKDHGNLASMYQAVRRIVGDDAPICLHENGPIPDPETLSADADWLYFMTWHSEFILDGKTNPPADLKRFYNADRYLTRDEIPRLATT
ncbi:mannan endo-1,4-beta-mannosidase A and B [Sphingomonas koreensis]|nr:mannan endo-1,4-beta-mannosidase A and B [Sphingomonas koreensis]